MDYALLGANIRKYRVSQGMKQEELAEKVGCSSTHIGMVENANSKPSLEIVVKIANALHVTPDQLLLDSVEIPELVYLKEMEQRLRRLPTKTKIMACEALSDLLDIIEQLHA